MGSIVERKRVLVVEDDDDSRELLIELVAMLGHSAAGSPNASETLRAVEETPPDVVLIDFGLPDRSGCELARELRRRSGGTGYRLIAVTGYSDAKTRKMAEEAGFDAFVVKPLSSEGLAALLAG